MGSRTWALVPTHEDLSSLVDGDRRDFSTTHPFKVNSLQVFRNGQALILGDQLYGFALLTRSSIRLSFIPASGERITIIYLRSA